MFLRPDRGCGRDGGVGSGSGAEDAKAAWADDASRWWFFWGARTTHNLTHFEGWTTLLSSIRVEKRRRAVDKREQRGPRRRAGSSERDGEGEVWVSAATVVVVLGLGWIVWQGQSGSGKKRVEWRRLHFPSLSLCSVVPGAAAASARCKVPGVEGVPSKHQSSTQAPSTPQEWARFVDF